MEVSLSSGLRLRVCIDNDDAALPSLILLNGAVFNLHQWRKMVRTGLWTRRFRLIRYDYADTGGSGRREGPVSVQALAEELDALLDALSLDAAHFYGVSQGTIVLQALAAAAPDRILSAGGYGWYYGGYSDLGVTTARIAERLPGFRALQAIWSQPLQRPEFEALWEAIYRKALMGGSWEELSWWGRLKDRLICRGLFPLVAPTPIQTMHDWFAYCVEELAAQQPWLEQGYAALAQRPLLIQHAIADQTLDIGMARELAARLPGARLQEYGGRYLHASPALRASHARQVVSDHVSFVLSSSPSGQT